MVSGNQLAAPLRFVQRAVIVSGREREGVIQAGKMAVAAVVAWLVAQQVHAPQSFIAPYAAVFLMSETVYRSLAEALRQVASLVLGVLLAFVVISIIRYTAVALAVAVFVGMVIGRWHRLGGSGIWVGVTALLMLTYGTANDAGYLIFRVVEGLIGAAVGVAVNFLVLPPVRLLDMRRAVRDVSREVDALLRTMSEGLRQGWNHQDATDWRRRACGLESAVRGAEEAAGWGRESTRLNPRWRLMRSRSRAGSPWMYETAISALYEATKHVQHITETLVSSADPASVAPRTGGAFDETFAEVLDELSAAVTAYQEPLDRGSREISVLRDRLDVVRRGQGGLAGRAHDGDQTPTDGSVRAALLLTTERAMQSLIDDCADEDGPR